jgi:shikimate dehydrogenase
MAKISGGTDIYLIPGDPITNVRAPRMFNRVFERCGLDAVMLPVQVRERDFAVWLKATFLARNVKGVIIAPPHKPQVVHLLDSCGLVARVARSVNIVRRTSEGQLEGDLFDGEGILGALDWFNIPYRGKHVLILGAGVSAAAIGVSLAQGGTTQGAEFIAFYDPVPGKAIGLATELDGFFDANVVAVDSSDPAGYDLVVNASAVGLGNDDPLPCDVGRMEPHAALFDILLRNQPTPLVRAARSRGLHAQPGFEMLIQQMPFYLDYFGLPEAAQMVREDANFVRELIYPPALAAEITQPLRYPCTSVAIVT